MGEAMSFRVGQEVVQINPKELWQKEDGSFWTPFNEDEVLVISGFDTLGLEPYDNRVFLLFVGYGDESFDSLHFRPVVKTDISIFQAMLAPSPKQRVRTDA